MNTFRGSAVALCMAFAALLLTGCGTFSSLFGSHAFVMPQEMPSDFAFHMERQGARTPEVNYLYKFSRSGSVDYWVKSPAASARPNEGTFEVSGNQLITLYEELRTSGIGELPANGNEVGVTGDLTFYVFAAGQEHRLVYDKADLPPQLVRVREAAMTLVPAKYRTADAPREGADAPPDRFVGDSKTLIFYASDDEPLKDVPPERRVFFRTAYEALDHGYYPSPETDPMKRVRE